MKLYPSLRVVLRCVFVVQVDGNRSIIFGIVSLITFLSRGASSLVCEQLICGFLAVKICEVSGEVSNSMQLKKIIKI